MKILTLANASTQVTDAVNQAKEHFAATEKGGKYSNIFVGLISDLGAAIIKSGYKYLLLTEVDIELVKAAQHRNPKFGNMLITNKSQATNTTPNNELLLNLVKTNYSDKGEVHYVDLSPWKDSFYNKETLIEEIETQELEAKDVYTLVSNLKLAFNLFLDDNFTSTTKVLRTNAKYMQKIGADCVLMIQPKGYTFTEDDTLVDFCRFIAHKRKSRESIGYTICHNVPIKLTQPQIRPDDKFVTSFNGVVNLVVAENISEESFAEGEFSIYENIHELMNELLTTFAETSEVDTQTLEAIKDISKKIVSSTPNKLLSFHKVKVAAMHADIIAEIVKNIHPDYLNDITFEAVPFT